jgi:hypothetical protein
VTLPFDLAAAEGWIRTSLATAGLAGGVGRIEVEKERPWATVLRVPVGGEIAWFKACRPVQAFEPALTAALASRWPDRLPVVLAHDVERRWLLTADAGTAVRELGNDPEIWLRALPRYAELQLGEVAHAAGHLADGVPDLTVLGLPARYEALLASDLPLDDASRDRLRRFAPRFASLCDDLVSAVPVSSIQHDDLHLNSLFVRGEELRFLDWGDASVSHPFFSLVVTFWFLETHNGLEPGNPWFARLRDAYLEPWGGRQLSDTFERAFRVGLLTHPTTWLRHRVAMGPADRRDFDRHFAGLLRWVMARVGI